MVAIQHCIRASIVLEILSSYLHLTANKPSTYIKVTVAMQNKLKWLLSPIFSSLAKFLYECSLKISKTYTVHLRRNYHPLVSDINEHLVKIKIDYTPAYGSTTTDHKYINSDPK